MQRGLHFKLAGLESLVELGGIEQSKVLKILFFNNYQGVMTRFEDDIAKSEGSNGCDPALYG